MRSWRIRSTELCPFFTESIRSTSQLQPNSVCVDWKATWVPRQLQWLDSLGKSWPGVHVEYYDVLDRYQLPPPHHSCAGCAEFYRFHGADAVLESFTSALTPTLCRYDQQSQFRWKALFNLFATAFRTGVLRLPVSSIETKWTVNLSEDGKSVAVDERTWLVPMFQQLKVKNRRIARDMLQWQEVRQPADMNYTMWDGKVRVSHGYVLPCERLSPSDYLEKGHDVCCMKLVHTECPYSTHF